jgi:hypothetical protein
VIVAHIFYFEHLTGILGMDTGCIAITGHLEIAWGKQAEALYW